ncbi:MAG TPA: LpqB family beta-propeller domain-containing protein [Mycobacteriales bacterium]|nr:LpqB family beta-propeller domain-containing protein [Mycobacteriales bacterium]
MRGAAAPVALVLLLTGCSLPLPRGVQSVGEVLPEQRRGGVLQVIPPGPRPGATPVEAVLGFLGAQASAEGRHAIARRFLSARERTSWSDDVEVQVYDPDRLEVRLLPGGPAGTAVVRVVTRVTGRVRADGSYVALPGAGVVEDYGLVRAGGDWQLDDVPEGLRLTAADRQRAFAPQPVYYLAPQAPGELPHLVPDQVFLPLGGDLARTLVARLLRPPSLALAGSVTTAVPDGARLRDVELSSSGVVTVDLTGVRTRPVGLLAQELSAQLVWTLRSLGTAFRSLRLLVDGRPLEVPGEDEVQGAGAWDTYDPEGLGPNPPYFFSSARRLRASVELPAGAATAGDVGDGRAVAVDEAAVTPDRTRVALLEGPGTAVTTVRVGPLRGRSFPVVARGPALTSPSWGSGDLGLWLVRSGREVVRVAGRGLSPVAVPGLPAGPVSSLRLSRDGARAALVVAGRLYVGRVELAAGGPRVVGLSAVLASLHDVRALCWSSSTELVVIGVLTRAPQVARVSVDGSSVQVLNTAGLAPTQVAASAAGVVLVSGGRLYRSQGGPFRRVQADSARAPVFPG